MDLMEEKMDKLKKRANELGLKFDDDVSEEDLKKLVEDKEKELESDIDYWKKEAEKWQDEAKKAFGKRDQFKGDRDKLADKIKEMEKSMKTMIPSDEKDALKEELDELKKFKEDYDKEREEEELKNKTEVERLQLQIDKQAREFQKQLDSFKTKAEEIKSTKDEELEKSRNEINQLRFSKLESEIVREAADLNAWRPSQIYLLTKDKFTYDPDLGKFTYQKRGANNKLEDEMSVKEYLTDFLGQEENENLIRSKANPNSFQTHKDKPKDKSTDLGDLGGFDPKDEEIVKQADFAGMTPERYIKIVKIPQKVHREKMAGKED